MTFTARQGESIFHGDQLVARWAQDHHMEGDRFEWSWYSPDRLCSTGPEYISPPEWLTENHILDAFSKGAITAKEADDLTRKLHGNVPVNRAIVAPAFHRGDFTVWEVRQAYGDTDNMFTRPLFTRHHDVSPHSPEGIGEAAKIVLGVLPEGIRSGEITSFLRHLISYGESHAA